MGRDRKHNGPVDDRPAADSWPQSRRLPFFFELAVNQRPETRRRTERLAIVVQRQIRHMQRIAAAWRRQVDHDRDWTPRRPFAKRESASAGETRVLKAFQHGLKGSYYSSALISFSKTAFGAMPRCRLQTLPSRLMMNDAGIPQMGPYESCTSSRPSPSRIG